MIRITGISSDPQDRNPEIGRESVKKLLAAVDEWIPVPVREMDKPFLLPVENTFSIGGRGTVVTGRVERGTMRKGDEAEFIGKRARIKTTITGGFVTICVPVCVCVCVCERERERE